MRKFFYLILPLILVCLTCFNQNYEISHKPKIFTMYMDSSFSLEERQAIKKAGNLWKKATKNQIEFKFILSEEKFNLIDVISHKAKNIILKANDEDPELFFFELANIGRPIIGLGLPGDYIILVPDRTKSLDQLTEVAAHEMGHHMKLKHTPSIMQASGADSPCITKYDLLQFCDVYNCDFNLDTQEVCNRIIPKLDDLFQ